MNSKVWICLIVISLAGAAFAGNGADPTAAAKQIIADEVVKSAEKYVRCRLGTGARCAVEGARLIRDCTAAVVSNVPGACSSIDAGSQAALLRTAMRVVGIRIESPADAFRGRSFDVPRLCGERIHARLD